MADHDDLPPVAPHLGHFDMHLGNERARCIEHVQTAPDSLFLHRLGDAVGREDHGVAGRYIGQFLNKYGALVAQILDHIGVMHNFMAHIDRRAELLQRAFDDFNRPIDSGAETPRLRQNDFGFGAGAHKTPMILTSNFTFSPARG